MRAEFAWSPFNGQHPQALPSSVRGRSRGHLLPQGEKAPVSFNGFPFGGSCRPQAADEGGVRVASLLTGSLRRLSPHPSAGGAADTFSPKGRRLLSVLKASPSGEAAARRRLMRAEFAWSPFNGQHPQALPSSVRGRSRGHLLPQGEKAPVSKVCPHPALRASFPFTSATCFITLAFVGPP